LTGHGRATSKGVIIGLEELAERRHRPDNGLRALGEEVAETEATRAKRDHPEHSVIVIALAKPDW
jgi:hypothetical protein